MKEMACNSSLINSLAQIGIKAYKIPDNGGMAQRFSPMKPFDILATSKEGHTIAIEGKMISLKGNTSRESFNFAKFEQQQIKELAEINSRKYSVGIVALYFWKSRKIHHIVFINVLDIMTDIFNNKNSKIGKELEEYEYYTFKKGIYNLPENLYDILLGTKNDEIIKLQSRSNKNICKL